MPANLFNLLIALLLALLLETTALAQEPTPEVLSLENAIGLAAASNRSLQNAELDIEKAKDRTAAYLTRRLPSFKVTTLVAQPITKFEFNFEKGAFGTFPNVGPVPAEDTKISSSRKPTLLLVGQISQPITGLWRVKYNAKQLAVQEEITTEQLRQKRLAVISQVKCAYYAILQTQSAARPLEESVRLYRELERVTIQYVENGTALVPDRMDVQARLAGAELELVRLNNLLASQKEQLNLLLGRDARTSFNVSSMAEVAQFVMRETDAHAAQQRALAQRPEVKTAQLRVKQTDYERRAQKTELLPDVSLTVSYVSPFNYSSFLPKNIMSAGVTVEWEPFDWGRRKRELAEKAKTTTQAENDLREAENQVIVEVNTSLRRLQEACQNLRVVQMSQTTAQANVKLALYRYREEAVLLKDVLQKQTALAEVNHQYQKALLDFWQAKADFEKAMGEEK